MSNRHRHRGRGYEIRKVKPVEKGGRDVCCKKMYSFLVIVVGVDDVWLVRRLEARICQQTIINPVYGNVP